MIIGKKLEELVKPVDPDLEVFDKKLAEYIAGDSPLVASIARHLVKNRGKRMRPACLFLLARASEYFNEFTIDASLAIELIHTATLLHDDVIDDSDLRRGTETVNFKWTNLVSVLMGDYLFAKAFRLMVNTRSIELIEAISCATERVSIGELRQVEETSNFDLSEEEYLKIIADKTASLFAVSSEAAPILAGQNGRIRTDFAAFGEKIGLAFQIADDLLDYIGDPNITGKRPGNDVISGKVTLPLIYSLRHSDRDRRRDILKILSDGVNEEEFRRILDFVTETGGIDYTYRRASEISREGLSVISWLKDSAYHRALLGMVDYSTSRAS
jgi:octaprenyl-diphosphate synthase